MIENEHRFYPASVCGTGDSKSLATKTTLTGASRRKLKVLIKKEASDFIFVPQYVTVVWAAF
jgi:hypothetical protein